MSNFSEAPTKARSLVEFEAVKSGAISVTDKLDARNNQLVHKECKTELEFMVQYQGYWFAIKARQDGTESHLNIHGIIGHLPFTYHSSFARTNIYHVVSSCARQINGKIRVDDQQRILLIDHSTYHGNLSPKLVIAETTKTLLKMKPYLELVTLLQPPPFVDEENEEAQNTSGEDISTFP